MTAVVTKGLTRNFGSLKAVQGVDLSVEEREVFGIVGPDAAGKTTLLRLLVGVLSPTSGQVAICGHDLKRERAKTRLLLGYMSQAFSLYEDLTVAENISFFASLRRVSRRDRRQRSERLLEATGLAPYTKREAGKLSGGMKQKLGLICTLIHEPQVLFLDEPTNGVDPVSRREFWDIIFELRRRISVVVTTPSLDEAERCDRVAFMADGKFLTVGTPDDQRRKVTSPVWEVEVDEPFVVAELLEKDLPQTAVQLFGDRLHVVHPIESHELERLLQKEGLTASIHRIEPSLEDAYVQLVGETV
jgi:ABC-2 type transport system ATP-binding protein